MHGTDAAPQTKAEALEDLLEWLRIVQTCEDRYGPATAALARRVADTAALRVQLLTMPDADDR